MLIDQIGDEPRHMVCRKLLIEPGRQNPNPKRTAEASCRPTPLTPTESVKWNLTVEFQSRGLGARNADHHGPVLLPLFFRKHLVAMVWESVDYRRLAGPANTGFT